MTELVLADGPTRYLGGSIETFALPYGAFILIAAALYFIFKRPHNVPRMRYLAPEHQVATGTREPGQRGMTRFRGALPASSIVAEAESGVPGMQPPNASETLQDPDILPQSDFVHPGEQAATDQIASNQATIDQVTAHQATQDQAVRDEAAQDQAVQDEAGGTSDAGA
ncbi:MAG: hypothetical protein M3Z75_10190 [Actinomycetota bacterium]|nr:hypothetical protein [Actinomycetota bacterium]